jgi:hypothetical protein
MSVDMPKANQLSVNIDEDQELSADMAKANQPSVAIGFAAVTQHKRMHGNEGSK